MPTMQISFTLIGEEREGGYTYFTSPELKGFRYLSAPDDDGDELEAMKPILVEHLTAYLRAGITPPCKITIQDVRPAPRANDYRRVLRQRSHGAEQQREVTPDWWHALMNDRQGMPMVAAFAAA